MGALAFWRKVVGQFSRSHIVKFGISAASSANASTRNRSGAITLPIKAVASGAPACILVPETHPLPAQSRPFFPKARCARWQVQQRIAARPFSSFTSTEAATRGLPSRR